MRTALSCSERAIRPFRAVRSERRVVRSERKAYEEVKSCSLRSFAAFIHSFHSQLSFTISFTAFIRIIRRLQFLSFAAFFVQLLHPHLATMKQMLVSSNACRGKAENMPRSLWKSKKS